MPTIHLYTRARLTVVALVLATTIFSGCDKGTTDGSAPKASTALGSQLTAEEKAAVRAEAMARLKRRLEMEPPYDRDRELRRILLEEYNVDLAADYPDGIDRSSLRDRSAIERDLRERVLHEADMKYPPEKREQLVVEAAQKFPIYEKGDRVAIGMRGGRRVEGTVEEIGPEFVKVGTQVIAYEDILTPNPVSFDKERSDARRTQYVKVNYDTDRETFIDENMTSRLPKELRQNGYVPVNNRLVRIDALIASLKSRLDKAEEDYQKELVSSHKAAIERELIEEGALGKPVSDEPDTPAVADAPREIPPDMAITLHEKKGGTVTVYPGVRTGHLGSKGDEILAVVGTGEAKSLRRNRFTDESLAEYDATLGTALNTDDGLKQPRRFRAFQDISIRIPNDYDMAGFLVESTTLTASVFVHSSAHEEGDRSLTYVAFARDGDIQKEIRATKRNREKAVREIMEGVVSEAGNSSTFPDMELKNAQTITVRDFYDGHLGSVSFTATVEKRFTCPATVLVYVEDDITVMILVVSRANVHDQDVAIAKKSLQSIWLID